MHNYTNYLLANNQINLYGASVTGTRIGMCSTNLTMIDTSIDVSGRGCDGDEGSGAGLQKGECAGSGGANGGHGGYGGIENDKNDDHLKRCATSIPEAYSFG